MPEEEDGHAGQTIDCNEKRTLLKLGSDHPRTSLIYPEETHDY